MGPRRVHHGGEVPDLQIRYAHAAKTCRTARRYRSGMKNNAAAPTPVPAPAAIAGPAKNEVATEEKAAQPLYKIPLLTPEVAHGVDIATGVQRLRVYQYVERRCIKILAGWFLKTPAYETKYAFGYHIMDHSEHVSWIRARLAEMRGGQPDANVGTTLRNLMEEALHAPDTESLLRGLYGVIKRELLAAYRKHLAEADSAANAVEVRLLKRLIPELEAQIAWYEGLKIERADCAWSARLKNMAASSELGQIASQATAVQAGMSAPQSETPLTRFERPHTIHFDQRIRIGDLTSYDARRAMDAQSATVEQFKVFFNEVYAAALLASILYDSFDDGYPWEYYSDFCHHFWDEVRHSEFGAIRLTELGSAPSVCNPRLFEASESLPVLHRILYLTLGLEVYFMPRKQPRVKEYAANGDPRSQLFADQDWSDETMHVRYGKKWAQFLLEDDSRTFDDIMEETRQHLERVTGQPVKEISAPY